MVSPGKVIGGQDGNTIITGTIIDIVKVGDMTDLPPDFPQLGSGLAGIAAEDVEAYFNMSDWLQAACEAKGAKMVGGGIGCGQADIDIELEGHRYNISIKPIIRGDRAR